MTTTRALDVTFMTSPELLVRKWEQAAPLFEPVITDAARGEFTVADLHRLAQEGRVICAVAEVDGKAQLAIAFEFVHYPQVLAVNIMALGGRGLADAAEQFWETFLHWCKGAGASVIEAACSGAMARLLERYGFETTYRVVRRPI